MDDTAVTLSPKKEDGATSKATRDLEKAIAEQEVKVVEQRSYLSVIQDRMSRKFNPLVSAMYISCKEPRSGRVIA